MANSHAPYTCLHTCLHAGAAHLADERAGAAEGALAEARTALEQMKTEMATATTEAELRVSTPYDNKPMQMQILCINIQAHYNIV